MATRSPHRPIQARVTPMSAQADRSLADRREEGGRQAQRRLGWLIGKDDEAIGERTEAVDPLQVASVEGQRLAEVSREGPRDAPAGGESGQQTLDLRYVRQRLLIRVEQDHQGPR